jgi:hypothetical protein
MAGKPSGLVPEYRLQTQVPRMDYDHPTYQIIKRNDALPGRDSAKSLIYSGIDEPDDRFGTSCTRPRSAPAPAPAHISASLTQRALPALLLLTTGSREEIQPQTQVSWKDEQMEQPEEHEHQFADDEPPHLPEYDQLHAAEELAEPTAPHADKPSIFTTEPHTNPSAQGLVGRERAAAVAALPLSVARRLAPNMPAYPGYTPQPRNTMPLGVASVVMGGVDRRAAMGQAGRPRH